MIILSWFRRSSGRGIDREKLFVWKRRDPVLWVDHGVHVLCLCQGHHHDVTWSCQVDWLPPWMPKEYQLPICQLRDGVMCPLVFQCQLCFKATVDDPVSCREQCRTHTLEVSCLYHLRPEDLSAQIHCRFLSFWETMDFWKGHWIRVEKVCQETTSFKEQTRMYGGLSVGEGVYL